MLRSSAAETGRLRDWTCRWRVQDDDVVTINLTSAGKTELVVSCPDKSGLGLRLARIIFDFGLLIDKGDFSTDGKWCFVVFHVSPDVHTGNGSSGCASSFSGVRESGSEPLTGSNGRDINLHSTGKYDAQQQHSKSGGFRHSPTFNHQNAAQVYSTSNGKRRGYDHPTLRRLPPW